MSKTLRIAESVLCSQDQVMNKLIQEFGPCTMKLRGRDPFDILSRSIASQQLSTKAADTILNRIESATACDGVLKADGMLQAGQQILRNCGLSNSKASYILGIAQKVTSGDLNFHHIRKLDNDDAVKQLIEIKGVGKWTAEMFLIFALGRLDVLSTGDVGLQKGAEKVYNLKSRPTHEVFVKIAEKWRPYRSVASWYLWRAV